MMAILKIKKKSTTLSDGLFLCQVGDVRYIALQWQFWFLLFLFFFHTFLSVRFRGDALIKLYETL
jgi:uncharacterized membrane protein